MSDHAGTNSRVRTIALSAFFMCLAAGCMAAMNSAKAEPQANHPCNVLRASRALDTARFDFEAEPGELVIGAYTVEGSAVRGAHVTLTPLPPSLASVDGLEWRHGGIVSPEGIAHISRVDPDRYQIKISAIGFEHQTQDLFVLAARTDSLCFVMRSTRIRLQELRDRATDKDG